MDERQNWRVEQLEKTDDNHEERLRELEKFKYSTVEKLKTIFERLRDIEKTNKWVSQSFFYLLFGGIISLVVSLVAWLITG